MVPGIGLHFCIAHLIEEVVVYKMRYSKVKSEGGKYAKISQQIWQFSTFTHFGISNFDHKF